MHRQEVYSWRSDQSALGRAELDSPLQILAAVLSPKLHSGPVNCCTSYYLRSLLSGLRSSSGCSFLFFMTISIATCKLDCSWIPAHYADMCCCSKRLYTEARQEAAACWASGWKERVGRCFEFNLHTSTFEMSSYGLHSSCKHPCVSGSHKHWSKDLHVLFSLPTSACFKILKVANHKKSRFKGSGLVS